MTPATGALDHTARDQTTLDLAGRSRPVVHGDGIVAVDLDGRCTHATPTAAALLGYEVRDLIGSELHDLVHPRHPDGSALPWADCPLFRAALSGGPAELGGIAYRRADGSLLVVDCRVQPILHGGQVIGLVNRFTEAFQASPPAAEEPPADAFIGVDRQGAVVAWSGGAQQLLGWTAEQALGHSVFPPLLISDERYPLGGGLREPIPGRFGSQGLPSHVVVRRADGTTVPVRLTGGWADLGGELRFHAFLREDVGSATDHSRARNEALYRLVVAASGDVYSQHGHDDEILDISESVEALTGWRPSQLIGRRLSSLIHPDDRDALRWGADEEDTSGTGDFSYRLRHRDGHHVWVETTAVVVRNAAGVVSETLMCTRDITARRTREEAQQEESRLESLGRLAAGLAHEINTPIQYVGDNARFLADAFADMRTLLGVYRQTLHAEEATDWPTRLAELRRVEAELELDYLEVEVPSAVAQTLSGIDRVSTIVRAMKTFSHPGHEEHLPADLNEALAATATVTGHQVGEVATLTLALGELPPVRCNVAQLNQAFLNLIVNAADAVECTGRRGEIRLSTEVDGEDAVVRVADTGGGIPDDVLGKIFEPFFTTKPPGRGTGQGLAQVRSVVQDGHGGSVAVTTEAGVGTVFTLRLPIRGARTT